MSTLKEQIEDAAIMHRGTIKVHADSSIQREYIGDFAFAAFEAGAQEFSKRAAMRAVELLREEIGMDIINFKLVELLETKLKEEGYL